MIKLLPENSIKRKALPRCIADPEIPTLPTLFHRLKEPLLLFQSFRVYESVFALDQHFQGRL